MTRKVFEIILIIVGLILGSLASIHGEVIPNRVNVVTNQDVQIRIKDGSQLVSDVEVGNLDILPIHYEDGIFYHSDTLSMDDLVQGDGDNYFQKSYGISLTKYIDNAYLQVEFTVDGDDAINEALRLRVKYLTNEWVLSPGESILMDKEALSTTAITVILTMWYELSDESCTIDNMNAATGSNYSINLYANVVE